MFQLLPDGMNRAQSILACIIIIGLIEMKRVVDVFRSEKSTFRYLSGTQIPMGIKSLYESSVYLTPRYQKLTYSEDFLKYVRFLQRSNNVPYSKLRQFVQNLLTQYSNIVSKERPNLPLAMSKDVYIPQNDMFKYHGKVDWIYSIGKFNLTPVMFYEQGFNPICGVALALTNMAMRRQMKQQFEAEHKKDDKKYDHINAYAGNNVYGYSILTTGHQWQLFRIDSNYLLEKSVILEGRNKYKSMIHDEQMISVLFGMLDYCLDLPEINVKALEKSYQYLEERRWMIEGEDDSEARNASWLSKILLQHYKKKL